MLIPGGDAFIENLVDYLKQHDIQLLQGAIALRLQPRALDFAASRLRSLSELQQAANSPLKDVSGSEVKGVGDYLRLERLAQLLSHVRCLKIESALPGLRDPTRISVEPFTSLKSLELRGCDLSTANWDGLPLLQANLQELRVYDTLEALHHLLAPHAVAVTPAGIEEQPSWRALKAFHCSHNGISSMDPSLRLLPVLQTLELSHSNLPAVANLGMCSSLTSLNLSHNRIGSLTGLRELRGSLRVLALQWNCLRGTDGIEELSALRSLDLGFNFVSVISEVVRLSGLSSLGSLRLAGNPVAYARSYRCDVLSCFPLPQQHAVRLDGAAANAHERQRLRHRTAGSGGRIAQVCSAASPPEDGDRPRWLRSDGQAWARLVDEVLGPAQARVTTEESSSWAYLGAGSSAGASAESSPRGGGDGSSTAGSPSKAPLRRGRRQHAGDGPLGLDTRMPGSSAQAVADFMTLRWLGSLPTAAHADGTVASAVADAAEWQRQLDGRLAGGRRGSVRDGGPADGAAAGSLQQELSLRPAPASGGRAPGGEAASADVMGAGAAAGDADADANADDSADAGAPAHGLKTAAGSEPPHQELSRLHLRRPAVHV